MEFRKELMGGATMLLVLKVLERSENHGYGIVKSISEQSSSLFEFKEGTVYPLLHRLEKDGYVNAKWEHGERGRKRKVYKLTASGKKILKKQTKEWSVFSNTVSEVLGVAYAGI